MNKNYTEGIETIVPHFLTLQFFENQRIKFSYQKRESKISGKNSPIFILLGKTG